MSPAAPTYTQLEEARRRGDERGLLFTRDGVHWRRMRMEPTGETVTRTLTFGGTTYTADVAVTAARDTGPVVFGPDRGAPQHPQHPGTPVDWDVGAGERIACASCDGIGTIGRPAICGCISEPRTVISLDGDLPERGPDDLPRFELDARRADHVAAAARRADRDCVRCDGTAIISQPCWNCRGIGWYWPHHTLTLTGTRGVTTLELRADTLAAYTAITGTRRDGSPTARVALADALAEHCAAVAGTGPWMLLTDRPGDAQLLDEWAMWRTSTIDATPDAYLQWFGRAFGIAADVDATRSWPPREPPTETPAGHTHLTVATAPDAAAVLAELVTDGPICIGTAFVATGQTGPVIHRCDDTGQPTDTLALDYHLEAAAIAALDVTRRTAQ